MTYTDNIIRNYGAGGFDNGHYLLLRIRAKANGELRSSKEIFMDGVAKLEKYKVASKDELRVLTEKFNAL